MAKKERRQPQRAAAAVTAVDQDWVSRRVKRHLADLESSNYTESSSGPSAHEAGEGGVDEKAPTALAREDQGRKRKKSSGAVRQLLMYRKTLATLIDESGISNLPKVQPTYLTAVAPPSRHPPLLLCSVCGYKGNYACLRCGLRYCTTGCQAVHDEARCERR